VHVLDRAVLREEVPKGLLVGVVAQISHVNLQGSNLQTVRLTKSGSIVGTHGRIARTILAAISITRLARGVLPVDLWN
jgi:hypothetical protein